ncbi:Protein of unknown function [Pseudonocardia thermophila]|jgi:hypothetical protein|uniref:DUF4245 domain-containing protein n=1 Tax=Pseudonocardia thermophila TaxID=1848 RepID=A0A1M6WHQ2_PSETH|nr:DUF4245 domain-containing protein [Pseudonocardia thermophila]SHK93280.1 Protein of unknown function [Pseudonocardia thermophila]
MSKPPRSALSVRDMVGAVVVLVVLALFVAGVSRSCTFAPGGPQVDQAATPTIDAAADLRRYAGEVPFPVRVPELPEGWRANSSGLDRVADGSDERVVRVGYLTVANRFLRLLQGTASEEQLLRAQAGGAAVGAQGPVDVDGTRWVVYTADEPIWIADAGEVRYLITGSASEADFRALAEAVQQAPVVGR